jgi:zona occludens toxin (predicted ATPase)
MCQQYGQVTLGVNRLVEATTKFRRLDRFGLKNRYQASVRGNPEELEVIRMFSGKYEPKLYAYYSSYALASVRETARGGSMLKSPTLLIGALGLVVAIAWFAFGGWLSGVKPVPAATILRPSRRSKRLSLSQLRPLWCPRRSIRYAFKAA